MNPPSEYDEYSEKEDDPDVSDLELPSPVLPRPELKRSIAIGAGLPDETKANQIESDQEAQFDSDGDVIMHDVEL